jgi:hypothetical protein
VNLTLDKYFRGVDVVTMRNTWDDANGVFVAFKAGDNRAGHSHLDLGSFVLDALGKRWAVDLGADDYNSPGYFDTSGQRWTYYRMRTKGHNTLVLKPSSAPDQNPTAAARIARFETNANRTFAIADLTPAYSCYAQINRGIALDGTQIIVQDDITAKQALDLWWFMHTSADIQLNNTKTVAVLQQAGVRLRKALN